MSKQLYEDLLKQDAGIAKAYRSAVGEKSYSGKVDKREANKIFAKAIDSNKITQAEARALVLVIEKARFSSGAKRHLINKLKKKAAKEALREGCGKLLVTDSELSRFNSALLQYTKKISFFSPGTRLRYRPSNYRAVKQLVVENEMEVYELQDSGLYKHTKKGKGVYVSGKDRLFIVAGLSLKSYVSMAVHETTHAIQDWRDITGKVMYTEADAYIAQGVAYYAMKRTIKKSDDKPWAVAFHGASKFVVEGEDSSKNKKWLGAYDDLVDVIKQYPLYSKKAGKSRNRDEALKDEKTRFRAILKKIKKKK